MGFNSYCEMYSKTSDDESFLSGDGMILDTTEDAPADSLHAFR